VRERERERERERSTRDVDPSARCQYVSDSFSNNAMCGTTVRKLCKNTTTSDYTITAATCSIWYDTIR